ncbi:hypothetical protein, partial [Azotobacter armeniacus]
GQASHLVLSFSRELSGIDLFHVPLYREFDCRVNNVEGIAALVLALVSIKVPRRLPAKARYPDTGIHCGIQQNSGNHHAPFTQDRHAPEAGQPAASSGV